MVLGSGLTVWDNSHQPNVEVDFLVKAFHDRNSQPIQLLDIFLLRKAALFKRRTQFLGEDYLAVPLVGGDFAPLLSGLQAVIDAAVFSSSGLFVFRFLLLVGTHVPAGLIAHAGDLAVTVQGVVSADDQEPAVAVPATPGKIARRHALVEISVQKADQAREGDLLGQHRFSRL